MRLDKIKLYFVSANLYSFSNNLISVFLNLSVLVSSSLMGVIYFNICYFAATYISFFGSAFLIHKHSPKQIYIASLILRAITLITFLAAAVVVSNIILFGLLYGVTIGSFWLANNILMSDISKGSDRTDFVYKNNLISSLVSFVAPTIAGILIEYSQFTGPLKFTYDFAAAIIFLIASAYTLHTAKIPKHNIKIKFKPSDVIIKSYKEYWPQRIYFLTSQLFTIPFSILLPIFVFNLTNNYVVAGTFASILLIVAIIGNYLTKIKRLWNALTVLFVLCILISSSLLLIPNIIKPVYAIFLFGIVYTIFSAPLNNQALTNFIELADKKKKDNLYFWINRESYFFVGRMMVLVGLVFLLPMYQNGAINLLYIFPIAGLYSILYLLVSERS